MCLNLFFTKSSPEINFSRLLGVAFFSVGNNVSLVENKKNDFTKSLKQDTALLKFEHPSSGGEAKYPTSSTTFNLNLQKNKVYSFKTKTIWFQLGIGRIKHQMIIKT